MTEVYVAELKGASKPLRFRCKEEFRRLIDMLQDLRGWTFSVVKRK